MMQPKDGVDYEEEDMHNLSELLAGRQRTLTVEEKLEQDKQLSQAIRYRLVQEVASTLNLHEPHHDLANYIITQAEALREYVENGVS